MSSDVEVEQTFHTVHEFLLRLSCAIDVDAMNDIIDTELGFTHFKALLILSRHGRALSVNELADELHLSLAAAGRAVDKLVHLDLVLRREDSHDRRIKRVSLAEAGIKAVAVNVDRREDLIREVIAQLPGDLRTNLRDALLPILAGDYLSTPTCSEGALFTQELETATPAAQ
ncbi:MarR family winged helix-turn-helix transcriptional regulator [Williamsia soli]|uniref:MarR family winged helix-turn-helix transcriptional regulator n=1 Tax=Williamsia soli TaxID=364929 RepID=UPI0027DD29A2|nr:MarR family transcriptional regulator [Williamsia soli]